MQNPYQTIPAEIIETKALTNNQTWFRLKLKLNYKPGQFIEISLPGFGEGPVAPCGDPRDKYLEIVVRDVGSLSRAVRKKVVGEEIFIRGPYGIGWPMNKLVKKDILMIAGGMGIIPIRPLLFNLVKHPLRYGSTSLLVGARDPETQLFKEDFSFWHQNLDYFKTIVDKASNNYKGRTGLITELVETTKFNPKKTIVLICGPEPMCIPCIDILQKRQIPAENIYISLERRMKCGIGKCQHCSCGKYLVCQDGPVFSWLDIKEELNT